MELPKTENELNTIEYPGLSGLCNFGNTCYFNSILQVLSNTIIFSSWLRENKYKNKLKKNVLCEMGDKIRKENNIGPSDSVIINVDDFNNEYNNSIVHQMAKLFTIMWRENCKITPKTLKHLSGECNSEFKGWQQNDSQELLNMFLDKIHEETKEKVKQYNLSPKMNEILKHKMNLIKILQNDDISRIEKKKIVENWKIYKKENIDHVAIFEIYKKYIEDDKYIENGHSIITDLFTGLFLNRITCNKCNFVSNKFEPFNNLQIGTPDNGKTTLEKNLKHFSKGEKLEGDEKYKCSNCKQLVEATKKIYIWEPPEILIIQLKRFKNERLEYGNHVYFKQSKTNSIIEFPIKDLELKDNYHEINRKKNLKYDLYAITEHIGSCKNIRSRNNSGHYVSFCKNPINNKWYEFNDSTIKHIPDDDLKNEIITKNAYILYYEKQ